MYVIKKQYSTLILRTYFFEPHWENSHIDGSSLCIIQFHERGKFQKCIVVVHLAEYFDLSYRRRMINGTEYLILQVNQVLRRAT